MPLNDQILGNQMSWAKGRIFDNSNCQEPSPILEAVGEFNVGILQPKLIGFVDASHG